MMPKENRSPRAAALQMLLNYESSGAFLNLMLQGTSRPDRLAEAKDRAFLTRLLYGTVERKLTLDYAIAFFTKKPADALSAHTRQLLRLGLYQIYYMEKVPAFAAVSETVSLSLHKGEASLINGVLRAALQTGKPPLPAREKNPARFLSVAYSVPLPTVKFFLSLYGESDTEALLTAFLQESPLTIRVNPIKISREDYLCILREKNIPAEPTAVAPYGIRILGRSDPMSLPLYQEGGFFVQDEASQIAGATLSPTAGSFVLDACAAPGGKSFSAAMYLSDRGYVEAFDLHESKLSLIREGARRLGLSSVVVDQKDATAPNAFPENRYDFVICDVPCSGLGVFGKKPDLRYMSTDRFQELLPIQKAILDNTARALKPGGVLVYSTCTLNPSENEEQVQTFLCRHQDFSLLPFTVGGRSFPAGMETLLPHKDGCDGFFIAKLQRNAT